MTPTSSDTCRHGDEQSRLHDWNGFSCLKNYVLIFETGLQQINGRDYYAGFDLLGTSSKHIHNQLILCLNLNSIEKQNSPINNGNFDFFSYFFKLCCFSYLIVLFIFIFEFFC